MNREVEIFLQMFTFIFVLIGITIGLMHFLSWLQDQIPGWMFFWLIFGVLVNGFVSAGIVSMQLDKEKNNDDDKKL